MNDGGDDGLAQSGLVYEPYQASPLKRWVLLDGNRIVLTALLSVAVCASVAALCWVGVVPVDDADAVLSLVGALVGGTLPFITIVLAINQLVLSQELGSTDELRTRLAAMQEFRREVETLTGRSVSPAAPADFLRGLVEQNRSRAETLESAVDDTDDGLRESVHRYVETIRHESETVSKALEDADFGTFDALSAVLGHFDGRHLHTAQVLRADHREAFDDEAETLDELIELLEQLAVARQTFKTIYVQHELAALSRLLLYVGFPTLFGGGLLMLSYESLLSSTAGTGLPFWLVAGGVTLVFLPFVVLLTYTLRIATVASRTADFGPFVPRATVKDDL
ncbi:hypothetical protein [Haloprofundus salinisoli]|uniref:hypothetical protein n=1 Tax=Haloprofundus salinisoli TaxID=2876193 RepID=UPI001CC9A048|nr:hypothetical protein [Haloprofundus salinisoli]